eukprot:CAMPEP_0174349596 /NCGR_PEP_ID=MMETSP0811_2-20130205/6361_1 /TAXON_ID=73025 ORGANISM="Eutreptiella gymnastica-like, Strain CCMP1594" /NCGR_SAMPLE_ID=MMETSP0811_2 /ASSEMBLY_ACC=CAM_ASM_000667 /LENGTH=66 /DNA_ID=CAMNT_0015477095 /DNA_START=312 /DNA_END=510 /DNA_ORIENTATION=-
MTISRVPTILAPDGWQNSAYSHMVHDIVHEMRLEQDAIPAAEHAVFVNWVAKLKSKMTNDAIWAFE